MAGRLHETSHDTRSDRSGAWGSPGNPAYGERRGFFAVRSGPAMGSGDHDSSGVGADVYARTADWQPHNMESEVTHFTR